MITNKQLEEYLITITSHILKTEYYKDPKISLHRLANMTKMPSNNISKSINVVAGNNFSDYINKFRIQSAMDMIKNNPELTISTISKKCGFHSRSSFYAAFQKQVKSTPTQWKKKNI